MLTCLQHEKISFGEKKKISENKNISRFELAVEFFNRNDALSNFSALAYLSLLNLLAYKRT